MLSAMLRLSWIIAIGLSPLGAYAHPEGMIFNEICAPNQIPSDEPHYIEKVCIGTLSRPGHIYSPIILLTMKNGQLVSLPHYEKMSVDDETLSEVWRLKGSWVVPGAILFFEEFDLAVKVEKRDRRYVSLAGETSRASFAVRF